MSRALMYFCVLMATGLASTCVPVNERAIPQVAIWSFGIGFLYSRYDAKKKAAEN